MEASEYCAKICGAKCCYFRSVPCPHLTEEKLCDIYAERFTKEQPDLVLVGLVHINERQTIEFKCGRIEQLLEKKHLPPEVEAQCCFAHPKLLQEDYGQKSD